MFEIYLTSRTKKALKLLDSKVKRKYKRKNKKGNGKGDLFRDFCCGCPGGVGVITS